MCLSYLADHDSLMWYKCISIQSKEKSTSWWEETVLIVSEVACFIFAFFLQALAYTPNRWYVTFACVVLNWISELKCVRTTWLRFLRRHFRSLSRDLHKLWRPKFGDERYTRRSQVWSGKRTLLDYKLSCFRLRINFWLTKLGIHDYHRHFNFLSKTTN